MQEGKSLSLWERRWKVEQVLSCMSICSTFRFASEASQPRDTSLIWNTAPVLTDFRLLSKMQLSLICITESLEEETLNAAFQDACEVLA